MKTDVLVIGGGPAGMACAFSAAQNGASVILVEREYRLGGILNQCIHNGFGLHYFNEELSGPEYAYRWQQKIENNKKIKIMCSTYVTKITRGVNFFVEATNPEGVVNIEAKSVILAMGCRERPAGAINLTGTRPAGIFTAGCAQAIVNLQGKMIGKKVVILGSGDIGLIMARRLVCEGAQVVGVFEIMDKCGGLARNYTQCLQDFNIPLHLSTTITRVKGTKRLTGVYAAPLINGKVDYTQEKLIPCDTLLLSVGLTPEIELVSNFNLEQYPFTKSYAVDEYLQTTEPGLFLAGNIMQVNDLVDNVSNDGEIAGKSAALYAKGKLDITQKIEIAHDSSIRYTIPKYIYKNNEKSARICFRTDKEYRRIFVTATSNKKQIAKNYVITITNGQIYNLNLNKQNLNKNLFLSIEQQKIQE